MVDQAASRSRREAEEDPARQRQSPTIDPERRELVLGARERWIRRLIDPSRNNSLLFYRDLKVGTLDLTDHEEAVAKLLAGKRVGVDDLIGEIELPAVLTHAGDPRFACRQLEEEERRKVQKSLVAIQRKALSNREERGIETLFLALGLGTWPAGDGGRPYDTPILLLPSRIESAGGRIGEGLRLQLIGEPQANLVLLYILEHDFRIAIDPEELLGACTSEDEGGRWSVDVEGAYRFMEEQCREVVAGFGVRPRAILANFQFARMAMVEDLRRHTEELVGHPLVAAIAGHGPSRRELEEEAANCPEIVLDEIPADEDHLVLDADSSQHMAIRKVLQGQNGVIQGPPGTGKSQTIANLIAELVPEGKRVLFVAEKRAALEAVMKRLRHPRVDLGHLVLDLHGASVSRKDVMARIAETLERIHSEPPVDGSDVCRVFETRRTRLNEHAERIGRPRPPTGKSVFEMQGLLLRAPEAARTGVRFRGPLLEELTEERVHEVSDWLVSAAALDRLFLGQHDSPWNEANVRTGEQAQRVIDLSRQVAHELWREVDRLFEETLSLTGVERPRSLEEADALVRFFGEVADVLAHYPEDLFQADPRELSRRLAPAARGIWSRISSFLTDGEYRAARAKLRTLRDRPLSAKLLRAEAQGAARLLEQWRALGGTGAPRHPDAAGKVGAAWRAFSDALKPLLLTIQRKELHGEPLEDAVSHLEGLAADTRTPYKLPQVYELRERLEGAGLGRLLQDIREEGVRARFWLERLRYAWLHSALDQALAEDRILATFSGRAHDRLVGEFRELDRKRLELAAHRVRRRHAERAVAAMNEHPEERDVVAREANKRSRHMPLRKLLREAPNVLTRIAPCWVASPLSVSQLLDGGHRHFDVVLFDEASQVPQEDAIPSILRAKQAVVAGDRHQLPPTTFFATQLEEEDEEVAGEAVEGFESLLDTMAAFLPNWMLLWHYRSHDERLIAFSNHHIYDDRLITFPGTLDHDVISHDLVTHDPGLSGQTRSSSREVERVVELVIEHAENRPEETLGVIAMGITHANRIQAHLDRTLELRPDLADFFSLDREERSFVKNLETVQGDERDAIILSIGYGKTADGDLPHRFGPLTHRSGHRRLNVAVTRARRRMITVSSFHHHVVDLARSGSRGVQLLKAYLEYAMNGGERLPQLARPNEMPLNAFEADIKDALDARGLKILGQFGASRYQIDLVAMHPERPGRPVLAIECDGRAYHSSASARDRDRLRQEHLMRLGWRFHRIWSTEWFTAREAEIERAVAAFEAAVRRPDIVDARQAEMSGAERRQETPAEDPPARRPHPRRGPPPRLMRRPSITDYSRRELNALAKWAMSDGLLRTDEDLLRDMLEVLGFRRLGSRIRARLEHAIRGVRSDRQ